MRNFRKILLFLGLACLLLTVPVLAAELPPDVEDALPREAGKLLDGVGQWDAASLTDGLRSIWLHLLEDASGILQRQTRGAASILLVVLLCSLVGGFQKTAGASPRFLTMAGTLAIAALTAGSLDSLMGSGAAAMEQMNTFSKALLPMLAAVSALSGGVAGATLRQIATVFFADLLLEVIHGLLMPMVYLYAGTLAAGGSLSDRRLLSVAEMIRSICVWLLTTALLLFTLYLTVSGIFAGTVDSARVRVAKTAISGVVPVVGGIIAEASETVLAGAGLLKGTIGVFGLLGVLALCAYAADRQIGTDMLNWLRGPRPLSGQEISFLNDRFRDGKTYLPFTYFAGSTPDNNYTPAQPYTIRVESNHVSGEEQGYMKLFIPCGGADSPRPIKLRQRGSDGKWFLWEQYLLTGVRTPKSADPWA